MVDREPSEKELEKLADQLLKNDAAEQGYITGPNNRGYGEYAKEHGILTSKQQSIIKGTEKGGFTEEQLESLLHKGVDKATRLKYSKD